MENIYLVAEEGAEGDYIVGLFTSKGAATEAAIKHRASESFDGGTMRIDEYKYVHHHVFMRDQQYGYKELQFVSAESV